MRFASIIVALTLVIAMAVPICSAGASNVALKVGVSDLCATAPLCTYWYADGESRGITPVMTVTNNGSAPIAVTDARLLNGEGIILGLPHALAPSGQAEFVLTEAPEGAVIQKRAAKHAVIFTISKIGE